VVWLEQHAQGRQMSGEALREVFDKEAFSYKDRDKVGSTS
jgi:hypothetical protein